MKKQYSPTFKAQIVLELLKEEKSVAQISSEHGIHPSQLHKWKRQAIEGLSQLFTDDKKAVDKVKSEYEAKLEELYAQIGRLTTQVNWFKK
ncbi:MAG: transposase, partial [Firmicutes bacterium]|nr:transposase [Bacillota bacterium]